MAEPLTPRFHPVVRMAWTWALPAALGIFLRLFALPGQVLVDDEWHSLNFVLGKSFFSVLTTHGLGANCIPQNAIHWLLLHTVGWSETTLYLPSVLCGIAGLLVFPRLVERIARRKIAGTFAWLFAISPCVIFYSRIVRPYSMVIFFGFLSLLCLASWLQKGRRGDLLGYALSGFAAIYFHLYAALPVLSPLVVLFMTSLVRPQFFREAPWITRRRMAATGLLLGLLLLGFLGPVHWVNPWWLRVLARDRVTPHGLWEFLSLLAGTRFAWLKLAFASLAAWGLLRLIRQEPRVGLLFASVWAACFLLLAIGSQDGMHAAIQIARYNIVLFPVALSLVAIAIDEIAIRLPVHLRPVPAVLAVAALAAGGPLGRTARLPNNFMHHSAFQDSYAAFDWNWSRMRALTPLPQMPASRIPPLYAAIAADPGVRGIIEYPMFIGDPLNFHYFYQHFHRKSVAAGYVPDFPFPPLPSRDDYVVQDTPIDYVFSRARALGLEKQMRFANLLPITDPARLRRNHSGWLLIVHRDLLRETLGIQLENGNFLAPILLPVSLEAAWGKPAFADSQILAWRIP